MIDNDTQTPNLEQKQIKRTWLGRQMAKGLSKLLDAHERREAERQQKVRRYEYPVNPAGINTIDVYTFGTDATVDRAWITARSPEESVIIEHTHPENGLVTYTVTEQTGMYENPNDEREHARTGHWKVKKSRDGQLGKAEPDSESDHYLTTSDQTVKRMKMGTNRRVIRVSRGPEAMPFNDIPVGAHNENPDELLNTVLQVEASVYEARLRALESE